MNLKGPGASIRGGAIAPPPYFGRIEGAAGQWRLAALLLAPPVLGIRLNFENKI